MKLRIQNNVLLFLYLFIFVFCSSSAYASPLANEKNISEVGWEATYLGSIYDEVTDTTTFSYLVVTAEWEKDLSHWTLVMEGEEVPTSTETNTSYGPDPTTGVVGFKWDEGQDAGTTMTYSITLTGDVGEGLANYAVKGGTYYALGEIVGPVGTGVPPVSETYSISGIVYVDVDMDSIYSVGEPLLSNVTVSLLNDEGEVVAGILTNVNGLYEFTGLENGQYTVLIEGVTPLVDDFNERLSSYFVIKHHSISITVDDSNVNDQDFMATISVNDILEDINTVDPDGDGFSFSGTGKTIGFWKHQHKVAISGKGRSHVATTTLMDYLETIEGLWLSEPFQFLEGNEFQHAFDIMAAKTKDANELLLKQLLATELNHVSGRGLSDAMNLQAIILNWAEYISANEGYFSRDAILQAKDLCDMINNSGE